MTVPSLMPGAPPTPRFAAPCGPIAGPEPAAAPAGAPWPALAGKAADGTARTGGPSRALLAPLGLLHRAGRSARTAVVDAVPALARRRAALRLRARMRAALGYEPDLRDPRTFNERLGHKILHDRDPRLPRTLDKIAVRDFVAGRIGPEYLVPLLGHWRRAADVPWQDLPRRFVLKANHGSGMNALVSDRDTADRDAILARADRWLAESHYRWTGEWGYRGIPPRLLAEAMLGDGYAPPDDYKVYVFGGRPRWLEVHRGRFGPRHHALNYDEALRPLPFHFRALRPTAAEAAAFRPPEAARELFPLAAALGAGFEHVRADFYLIGGRAVFGELTHYTGNASDAIEPVAWDHLIGRWWAEGGGSPPP